MDTLWAFSTYTFPVDSLPTNGGEWDDEEKIIEHEPLTADVTVITSMGFKSSQRVVVGHCSRTFRDQMKTFRRLRLTATLVDGEGRAVSARIMAAKYDPLDSNQRFKYTITFKAR